MRDIQDFASLKIKLASPETIRAWSYGEVKKPETINYRTLRPERDGLFCEKIFGTTKEWECYCGKFKSIRYKGVICDRCGVEVTHFKVRRERTGHIELAAPVSHIWYYHSVPSRMGLLLDLPLAALRSVLYYEKYIVINPGANTDLKEKQLLTEDEYNDARERYGESFTAGMGAEAIKTLLENLDLDSLAQELRQQMREGGSKVDKRTLQRIEIVENFRSSGNKASWMILDVIPVIPPELRPMVQLEGGRFATSDLNDLYRRVINRNNRLKRLQGLFAPDIIIRNEKRMLQEAVDALFDNGKRKQRVVKGASNRPLKSISDMLKGKQGRFRQNLLGKRVDYSGRSVIVVGPELKLWQCGLPEKMALELFKPFIMKKLVDKGIAGNIKKAKTYVDTESSEVYAILDEVVREHPVMLNRAPTLHRLGIQAFEPVLVPGKALMLHPLACKAFNADFDGDQMAIHVPLTQAAQMECWNLMLSARNLLDPANGNTIVYPSQDMVLGIYYMTAIKPHSKGAPEDGDVSKAKIFSSADEVRLAASSGAIEWQALIRVPKKILNKCVHNDPEPNAKYIATSAGRLAFNEAMPPEVDYYNEQLGDKELRKMIERVYHTDQTSDKKVKAIVEEKFNFVKLDEETLSAIVADKKLMSKVNDVYNRMEPMTEEQGRKLVNDLYNSDRSWLTIQMLDDIKATGYKNATFYGATLSMDDILIPDEKKDIVERTTEIVNKIIQDHGKGAISEKERREKSIAEWSKAGDELTDTMYKKLANDKDGFNTIYMMANSGARGSKKQISQLAAMRGLMQKPNGEIIELPIKANFKEGLSVIEYFISSNGARKGLSDTALKTADAGYMTRRLVDVAQNVVVNEEDCGTINGIDYAAIKDGETVIESLASRIAGHFSIERVLDPVNGELLCDVNQYIDEALADKIDKAGVEKVKLRTVLTCESKYGICVKCYGKDLARNKIVEIGEAVGTIAAQSIGQPGTQLTLRTFHTGGAAETSASDNHIKMKYPVYILSVTGTHVPKANGDWLFTRRGTMVVAKMFGNYPFKKSDEVLVQDGSRVRKGNVILKQGSKETVASDNGRIIIKDNVIYLVSNDQKVEISNGSIVYAAFTKSGTVVDKNVPVGEFDPFNEPIIAEVSGYVHFEDVIPGSTVEERETLDKNTGKKIVERKITDLHLDVKQPRLVIRDEEAGDEVGSYHLPVGTTLKVDDKQWVDAGVTLGTLPKEGTKANDITLGLPRVSELFEGRKSKNPAVISKISGLVKFGKVIKGKRTIIVTSDYGKEFSHAVPINKRLLVRDGDQVEAGEPLCDGAKDPHDVLAVLGENELQNFLLNEIQSVYRSQGVTINDKHIGTIIRQMLKKVEVTKVGDTRFIYGQQVDKYAFHEENNRVIAQGGEPAIARPMFQGITKAALATDSFISASSFQETTKVLTNAAIAGAEDRLHGLKENVIIGHMIPAGTGMRQYHNVKLSDSSASDLDAKMEEILELRRQEKLLEQQAEEMSMGAADLGDED
ncbi:MAG: DNA-directed RNA polymerase subunit beta' [Treponema sp.]|nr:DNA-directed RNA polymerase subunit beta' [Treponema sp.]